MHDKTQLITMLREEFNRWEDLLTGLSEEQITDRTLHSDWTIKDVVAHLWTWQQLSVARMEAALHNTEPEYPGWPESLDPDAEDDTDEINQWIYDTNREKPWSTVYQDWKDRFLRLLELAEAVPEKDLMNPERYAWLDGHPLALVLLGSYEHHHDDHLQPLLARLSQDGDEETAD